jgi:hypothetical protein
MPTTSKVILLRLLRHCCLAVALLGGRMAFGGEAAQPEAAAKPVKYRVLAVETTDAKLRKALGKAADVSPGGWFSSEAVASNLKSLKRAMMQGSFAAGKDLPWKERLQLVSKPPIAVTYVGILSSKEIKAVRARLPASAIVDLTPPGSPFTAEAAAVDAETTKIDYRYQAGTTTITSSAHIPPGYGACIAFSDPARHDGYKIYIFCPK